MRLRAIVIHKGPRCDSYLTVGSCKQLVAKHLAPRFAHSGKMLFRGGLEPPTQRFSVFCSNQLSYLNEFGAACSNKRGVGRSQNDGASVASPKHTCP